MDQVVWVDDNDQVLGRITREQAHVEGLLHRVGVVYLFNDQGQILIQERAARGLLRNLLDHSSAGHVDPGETYLQTAHRELREELGTEAKDLEPLGQCRSSEVEGRVKHMFMVYRMRGEPGKLSPEEVKSVYWANPHEVWEDMKLDPENKKYTGGFKATLEVYLKQL